MLKHLGVCRAGGGEKPPKSGGGGSERQRAKEGSERQRARGGITLLFVKTFVTILRPADIHFLIVVFDEIRNL